MRPFTEMRTPVWRLYLGCHVLGADVVVSVNVKEYPSLPLERNADMTAIRRLVSRYPLIAFFAIACVLTWLGWTLPERIYAGTLLSGALALPFFLMVPGPLYAALIVSAITGGKPGVVVLLKKFTI